MSQAACPRCNETIRIPDAQPPADASARCPWCRETYSFEEFQDRLPPMLEWVDNTGTAIPYSAGTLIGGLSGAAMASAGALAGAAHSATATHAADGFADIEVDDEPASGWSNDSSDAPAFTFDDGEEEESTFSFATDSDENNDGEAIGLMSGAVVDDSATPAFDNPLPRPKGRGRKSASPLKTMIQMVLGGVVSIPLAAAILYGVQAMGWRKFDFLPDIGILAGEPQGASKTAAAPGPVADSRPSGRQLGGGAMPDFDAMNQREETFVPQSASDPAMPENDSAAGLTSELADGELADDAVAEPAADEVAAMSIPELPADDASSFDTASSEQPDALENLLPAPSSDVPSPFDTPAPEMTVDASTADDLGPSVTEVTADPAPAAEPQPQPISPTLLNTMERVRNLSTDLAEYSGDSKGKGALLAPFYYALAEVGEQGQPEAATAYAQLIADLRAAGQLETMAKFGSPWVSRGDIKNNGGLLATGTLEQRDDELILQIDSDVSVPLDGWDENKVDPQPWVGKEVVVLAKLAGAPGQRQGTIRYIEGK